MRRQLVKEKRIVNQQTSSMKTVKQQSQGGSHSYCRKCLSDKQCTHSTTEIGCFEGNCLTASPQFV